MVKTTPTAVETTFCPEAAPSVHHAWPLVGGLIALALASWPADVAARPTGEPQPCGNCHYRTEGPALTLTLDPEAPGAGEQVNVRVEIEATNGEALRTGLMLLSGGQGSFVLLDEEGTRFADPEDPTVVLHAAARDLDAEGRALFEFDWVAPDDPGVTTFTLWSITGNSNGDESDDHHATIQRRFTSGCEPITVYPDGDGDGFGDDAGALVACEAEPGLVEQGGDCNDDDPAINPDAVELCNIVDDNCNDEIDEGLDAGLYYPDEDGDGFGTRSDAPEFTCEGAEGSTLEVGDCDPFDPDIYPGAPERPNGLDDDCDGEIDEQDDPDGGEGGEGEGEGEGDGEGEGGEEDGDVASEEGCGVAPGHVGGVWPLVLLALLALSRGRERL